MISRRSAALTAAALGALTIGCGSDGGSGAGEPEPSVIATTTHAADLVRNVAGSHADVKQLLQANSDPHDYEPRPSDARAVAEADLLFRSGGELDEWLGDLLESSGADAEVVTLIDAVRRRGGDPHWWQDPRNAQRAVRAIRDALVAADPEGRRTYARNADAYLARIRRLDAAVEDCLKRVPVSRRKLVSTHDSLAYYAQRYDIEVIGTVIPSLSTQGQPSAGETRELVETIERERVKAIFTESSVNPRVERAIAEEAGASIGAPLWADTLGPEGSSGDTYVKSIAANTRALASGFTGGTLSCRLPS